MYNELPQTPMNMNQVRAKKLIDQRSQSRQKEIEKRHGTTAKVQPPSGFTVDGMAKGAPERGTRGPNSVMYNTK